MKLEKIFVKTVEGRVARTGPRGMFIPSDKGMFVMRTPYIDRLLNFHKDIEETTDPERPLPRSTKPKPGKPDADAPAQSKPPVATAE